MNKIFLKIGLILSVGQLLVVSMLKFTFTSSIFTYMLGQFEIVFQRSVNKIVLSLFAHLRLLDKMPIYLSRHTQYITSSRKPLWFLQIKLITPFSELHLCIALEFVFTLIYLFKLRSAFQSLSPLRGLRSTDSGIRVLFPACGTLDKVFDLGTIYLLILIFIVEIIAFARMGYLEK